MPDMKHCPTCPEDNQWHPATTEFFSPKKSNKDKLSTQCKKCRNKREQARRIEKREEIRAKANAKYHDPALHEQILAQRREYDKRPEVHERRLARDRAYQSRPEVREHRRAHMRVYNRLPYVRKRERIRQNEQYHNPDMYADIRAYHNAYDRAYRKRPYVQEKTRNDQRVYMSHPESRERHNTWQRGYYRRPGIHEKLRAGQRIYYQVYYARPESQAKKRVDSLTRVARKKAVPGTHTAAQIAEQLKRQHYRCYYAACGSVKFPKVKGKYAFHIEHTFPISRVVGTDIPANDMSYLVLSCDACNLSKGNKYPWEWYEGGRLL